MSTAARRASRPQGRSVIARRVLLGLLSDRHTGVTVVSGPAGSGKTVLLRSWIDDSDLAGRVAWVSVERGEQDAQRFWLSVIEKLRPAVGTDAFVEKLTPTPEFDGGATVERLVSELGSLDERVVLVIDDLHELHSGEALSQLEVLLARRPPLLRVVLATRHDQQLRLHRLRLAEELTEVREADLRFTLDETRELLAGSGIALPDAAVEVLHARTEGWVAGLRLAALALAGHPAPERFVAEFSGSERTVAAYLLAEVLERQPEEVRRLLLRTSVLERVSGALADALVGTSGTEAMLHRLEDANAFVVSLDAARSWFRYHHLFADLLRLELRRTEPNAVPQLHRAAARWYEEHGHVLDAVRHAQAGDDWPHAARLLADHWVSLSLNGQQATVHELLAAFPVHAAADPELLVLHAADQANGGSLDDAAAYLLLAERHSAAVPSERRRRFDVSLGLVRLALARRRGDRGSVAGEVASLLAPAAAATAGEVALSNDARALALLNLGILEQWSVRSEDAERHFVQALDMARRIARPYLEVDCLGHLALADAVRRSFTQARKRSAEAVAIAEAHGWAAEPIVAVPLGMIASVDVWQGRFEDARHWLERAERALLRAERDPLFGVSINLVRGRLLVGQGRLDRALGAFRAAEALEATLGMRHALVVATRLLLVLTQLRLGELVAARETLARTPEPEHDWVETRAASAAVHLAGGEARAAIEVLAPVLDGSAPALNDVYVIQALLVDAMARDLIGDDRAAEADVERALSLAEPDGLVWPFVMTPTDLLGRHPRHRTAHATHLAAIQGVLAGSSPRPTEPPELRDGLSKAELRVLRYLPSNLSAPEIGRHLYLSLGTVKTHMRHIYAKLGVHRRTEAVERARELGLLSPSSHLSAWRSGRPPRQGGSGRTV